MAPVATKIDSTTIPDGDVARELRLLVERLAVAIGLEDGAACHLATAVEQEFRHTNGGCRIYVRPMDRGAVKACVHREFDGHNRDELCARYGISRATFYRMIGTRRP